MPPGLQLSRQSEGRFLTEDERLYPVISTLLRESAIAAICLCDETRCGRVDQKVLGNYMHGPCKESHVCVTEVS